MREMCARRRLRLSFASERRVAGAQVRVRAGAGVSRMNGAAHGTGVVERLPKVCLSRFRQRDSAREQVRQLYRMRGSGGCGKEWNRADGDGVRGSGRCRSQRPGEGRFAAGECGNAASRAGSRQRAARTHG